MAEATLKGDQFVTFRDLASGLRGDRTFDHDIVDMMVQKNPILDDIPVVEANEGRTMVSTVRTSLPEASWGAYYEGVKASKSGKQQARSTTGMLKTKLEIDAELFDKDPNKSAFLADEVAQHSKVMGNEMAEALFYGSLKDDVRKFNGLFTFFNKVGANAATPVTDDKRPSYYVWNAAKASSPSTSMLRSIALVGWGNSTIRGFYPQGSNGGMRKGEFKKVDVEDTVHGGTYEAYRQYFYWDMGLDIRDFRACGRMANIELDAMLNTSGQPDYIELLDRFLMRSEESDRKVLYMDKHVFENLKVLFSRKTRENAFSYKQLQERMTHFLFDVPVRFCDAMKVNEDQVL